MLVVSELTFDGMLRISAPLPIGMMQKEDEDENIKIPIQQTAVA